MTEKKELKDYSIKELADAIETKRAFLVIVTEKELIIKKCDLYKLAGLVSKANIEIIMAIKQMEKPRVIVPGPGTLDNIGPH